MSPSAQVIADSVSPSGDRLTTMEVVMHRFVLAQFNTHRAFSRNSASSRAIPYSKQRERVVEDCAFPLSWPAEQKGMQGGEELLGEDRERAVQTWEHAAHCAVEAADSLRRLGVHKSVTNRLLEPFMWHTVIVTATEWDGFFEQRCSPLAQPEVRVVAEAMRDALRDSTPRTINFGDWHLPYLDADSTQEACDQGIGLVQISAARCARVSYLTHDGQRDIKADAELFDRLVSAQPPHWSPLEHAATPAPWGDRLVRNLRGWVQLRTLWEKR